MTILKSLKELIKKRYGYDSTAKTISSAIEDIEEAGRDDLGALQELVETVTGVESAAETVSEAVEELTAAYPWNVLIKSSTEGSTKVFKLKVVDAGTLSAEEVV